ncbi:MAG: S8 family serine peptidase [Chitinophagales bacterium]
MRNNPKLTGLANINHSLFAISILALSLFSACKNMPPQYNVVNKVWASYLHIDTSYPGPDPKKQLIVWLKPATSDVDFKNWLDSVNDRIGTIKISNMCRDCNDSLFMITGPGAESYIQGQTAGGGSGCTGSRCGPSGDDGPVLYSINFDMEFTDSNKDTLRYLYSVGPSYARSAIPIGIFDTGVDPAAFSTNYYSSSVNSCLIPGTANNGWNFVAQNNNWTDDYPSFHGTQVTGFVVNQAKKFAQNSASILPVKIHDKDGHAGLFNVLCAFAYASNRGVKIINASFGYYAAKPKLATSDPDSCALLIKAFVKKYTTDRNILLIAAAGNSGNTYEDTAAAFQGLDKRNLDDVAFYPASLGANQDFKNVITVTTVDTTSGRVSPHQNYSANVVDIGVNADRVVQDTIFVFMKPGLQSGLISTVEGSSFATPIATGIIAAHYFEIASLPADKTVIISTLSSLGLAQSVAAFRTKIKNGIIMYK